MQTALSQQRCLPASTSGRCSPTSFDCSEDCPGSSGRLLGRLAKSRTLLLRRGSALRGSYSRRCSLLPACCQPRAAGHVGALQIRSSAAKRDVRAQARSTAGQVGVAAVEEVVDAPHPEVLSYSSLPVSFAARTVRDSYLSVQNVESLTRELAEVGEHLERLVASEDTPSSRAYSESEMSEEDYKRLQEARRQHEDELKARRELRAIRRKASQAKAAAEKAATAATPMVTSSNPVRERTRSGVPGQTTDGGETAATSSAPAIAAAVSTTGAGARGAKAAAVKAAGRAAGARTPTGARVTAAARTRSHASWGKRHVEKPTKDAFQRPAQSSAASATNTTLYAVTKMQGFGQQSLLTAAEEKVLSKAVQRLIAMEAKQTEATQRLGRPITEREWAAECGQSSIHAFRKAVKVGQEARTRMMKSNERLVFHVARRYMNRGLDFQDLLAEGMSGLWRGVEKFDADRGFKFSTYAHWWVRQAITRAISEQGRVVRLPVHLHELMAKVTKVDLEYQSEHGRRAGNEKLAELVGISQEKLAMLSKVYMAPTSFNAPVGGSMDPGADTVGETIADDNEASPEEVAVRLNLHQDMDNVLATLSERESGILRCRYGLDDGRQRTLEEVGQIFKVTRERIRQIEAKAILKLRQPDRSSILYDYVNGASTQSVTWRGGRSKCHSS